MKRETSTLAVLVFVLALPLLGWSQGQENQPGPVIPSNILGPQLIAWSQVQKPQPVPQPLPPTDVGARQPDRQEQQISPSLPTPSGAPSFVEAAKDPAPASNRR
jgi:hypothetical protein